MYSNSTTGNTALLQGLQQQQSPFLLLSLTHIPLFNFTLLLFIKHFLMALIVTDIVLAARARCSVLYTDITTSILKTKSK